jgi:peptidoglycan hydrolase-like protein with peptidoglycan-binding domain
MDMRWKWVVLFFILASGHVATASGDELTQIVQEDLINLGYDPGPADGHPSTKTIIAVSRFQSEQGLEVTGEITPQLAGVIKATISKGGNGAGSAQAASTVSPEHAAADLKVRQEACLQEKVAEAKQSAQMKSGLSKLFSAVSRTASSYGGGEVASQVSTSANDASSINATVSDLEGAAKDLGISQSDIDACKNP